MVIDKLVHSPPCTVPRSSSVEEAAKLMRDRGIGSLVVVDEESRPVGVVTDRDVVVGPLAEHLDCRTARIGDLVKRPLVSIPVGASLADAVRLMRRERVRRLVVTTPGGVTAGVVSFDAVLLQLARRVRGMRVAVEKQII